MPSTSVSEETDKSQYLRNHPEFRKCRIRLPGTDYGHQLPDWRKVRWQLVQNSDPRNPLSATHCKVLVCARCGAKWVDRYHIVTVRQRKTKALRVKVYQRLSPRWDYTGTDGYLFGGGERIAPAEAAEVETVDSIESAADFPGVVDEPASASPPRRQSRKATAPAGPAPRKAVAAARKAS